MLKEKVQEILTKKLEKKEKASSCGDKNELNETNQSTEPVKEVVESNIKSDESKSAEKYSSTFESDDDNNGMDTKSGKSAKSDSEDEEKSGTVPSEKSTYSSDNSPENVEEPVNIRETPPPAPAEIEQKMLSTIEEVTTVADTEDNEEDYSDNFVSSNISSNTEVQYSPPTSVSVAASKDVTELESFRVTSLQEREGEGEGEAGSTDEDQHDQEPAVEVGQDHPRREEAPEKLQEEEEEGDGGSDHQSEEDQGEDHPGREDGGGNSEPDQPNNSPGKEAVFVSLPLELSNDESVPTDVEEDHRDHTDITEEDLDSLQDQVEEQVEELKAPDDSTHQEPLSEPIEVKPDESLPTGDEDTADNIETGLLSSDDTEAEGVTQTDGGLEVTEDPPPVDILQLDVETGFLTPEKAETDQDDPVLR